MDGLVLHRFLGALPAFLSLEGGLENLYFSKFLGNADAAGVRKSYFENHCLVGSLSNIFHDYVT